jgi:hypothetical protein
MTEQFEARTHVWEGAVYSVRDRQDWHPGEKHRCEYGVIEGYRVNWKPCDEGVAYPDIEPLVRLSGA